MLKNEIQTLKVLIYFNNSFIVDYHAKRGNNKKFKRENKKSAGCP
jgi:hypothetical protein